MGSSPSIMMRAGLGLAVAMTLAACRSQPASTQRPDQPSQPGQPLGGVPPALAEQIEALSRANAAAGATFTIGFNSAALKPVEDLIGTIAPADLARQIERQRPIGAEMYRLDLEGRDRFIRESALADLARTSIFPELRIRCMATSRSWDWRSSGAVSPVKNQQCGNCWAYAAAAAYESSYLIRNTLLVDVSEQYIVDCAAYDNGDDAGTCGGGWHAGVFEHLVARGIADEALLSDTGVDSACNTQMVRPYRAVAWAYVDAPAPAAGFSSSIPTTDALKEALCAHGPLAVAVLATPNFQLYNGGVFNESLPDATLHSTPQGSTLKRHNINHDVLLIGWDDSRRAWLIKNSWGTGWGINAGVGAATDRGYMWIRYGSNNIGLGAAWVRAQHRAYRPLPMLVERFRIPIPYPDPGPLHLEDFSKQLQRQ